MKNLQPVIQNDRVLHQPSRIQKYENTDWNIDDITINLIDKIHILMSSVSRFCVIWYFARCPPWTCLSFIAKWYSNSYEEFGARILFPVLASVIKTHSVLVDSITYSCLDTCFFHPRLHIAAFFVKPVWYSISTAIVGYDTQIELNGSKSQNRMYCSRDETNASQLNVH